MWNFKVTSFKEAGIKTLIKLARKLRKAAIDVVNGVFNFKVKLYHTIDTKFIITLRLLFRNLRLVTYYNPGISV